MLFNGELNELALLKLIVKNFLFSRWKCWKLFGCSGSSLILEELKIKAELNILLLLLSAGLFVFGSENESSSSSSSSLKLKSFPSFSFPIIIRLYH